MKKTIKIIDLLNKIANGEEAPKTIIYNNYNYTFESMIDNLIYFDNDYGKTLNDEVEILDEEVFEDIKPLEQIVMKKDFYKDANDLAKEVSISFEKIDDIVININQLIKIQKKIIEKLNKSNNN